VFEQGCVESDREQDQGFQQRQSYVLLDAEVRCSQQRNQRQQGDHGQILEQQDSD
jgi:hypothetical protein